MTNQTHSDGDLDNKLKKILREFSYYKDSATEPDTIAQIKQAFADDPNWVHYGVMPLAPQIKKQATEYGLMTGSEWYQRFMRELDNIQGFWPTKDEQVIEKARIGMGALARADIKEAARKASGVEK